MLNRGRILAIDYGERRIGLALSDEMRIIASGAGTITSDADALAHISDMVRDRDVCRIVVGLPLTLRGEEGASAEMVQKFVKKLREILETPVDLMDERFTSSLAQQTIRDLGVGRKKRKEKGKIDEIAAVILLQGYLDSPQKNTAGL